MGWIGGKSSRLMVRLTDLMPVAFVLAQAGLLVPHIEHSILKHAERGACLTLPCRCRHNPLVNVL
jgi:hypothetical protein